MSDTEYLKSACPQCGGHINFPPSRAGEMIDCPHCGEQTKLFSNPEKSDDSLTKKPANIAVAILLVLILIAAGVMFYWRNEQQSPASQSIVVIPAITNVFIPKAFTQFNDFKINKITSPNVAIP